MNFLKRLFARRMDVTFILKSGVTITVQCNNIATQTRGGDGAELVGYKLLGTVKTGMQLQYIRLDDVSAIVWEQ